MGTTTKTTFKSSSLEKRWIELQAEKADLLTKKSTTAMQDKIDLINSLMTACKVGFTLTEAKVKKVTKFMKEHTGNDKVKYGSLPTDIKPLSALFKDTLIVYAEKDGQIIFREFGSK
jgi:hypothetical protein